MPANITEGPVSLNITQPDTASFNCTASGVPRPSIWWIGPNNSSMLSERDDVNISLQNINNDVLISVLMLSEVNISRNGTYTCSASNGRSGFNVSTVKTADLYVHGMFQTLFNTDNSQQIKFASINNVFKNNLCTIFMYYF